MSSYIQCHCTLCNGRLVNERVARRHVTHSLDDDSASPSHSDQEIDYEMPDMDLELEFEHDVIDPAVDVKLPDLCLEDQSCNDHDDSSESSSASDSGWCDPFEDDSETEPDMLGDQRERAVQYAMNFIEQKYTANSTAAQVTLSMQMTRRCLADATDDKSMLDCIPKDFQQAITRTKHLVLDMEERHGCVKDHYLFPTDPSVTRCPVCNRRRFSKNGAPRRVAYYVRPKTWFRQLLTVRKLSQHFDYMREYLETEKYR
jgi:hypothetical protein